MIYDAIDHSQNTNSDITDHINQTYQPILNSFAYLISQLLWFLCIATFIGSGFLFQRHHPSIIYKSDPIDKPWDSSQNPLIFTQSADIHTSVQEPDKVITARALINSMKFYKSDLNIITGDIVNQYSKKSPPKIGHQYEPDWKKWKSIIEEETGETNFPILDLPGNHDVFSVDNGTGPNNYYLNYSYTFNHNNTKNIRDFNVRTVKYFNLTFLLINPIRFPSPPPPYAYWVHPTREMLDQIEDEIDKITDKKFFVLSHFPIDVFWWIKSSRGHSFEQMMENKRIIAYLCGHFHPETTEIIHRKNGLEVVVSAAYQYKKFGVITIDNDRLVFNTIDLQSPPVRYLLTHPVPIDQLSGHQKFSEMNTEIRLIAYEKKTENETVLTVSGAVEGEMKFERTLPNGASLYTFPLKIEKEGKYIIHITGRNCNITREFFVGSSYKSTSDAACCYQRGLLFVKIASIPIFICLFWINWPLNWPFEDKYQSVNQNIENGSLDFKDWLVVFLLGPSLIHQRMSCLPKSVRLMFFIFLFYPIFLPHHFFATIFGLHGCPIFCFIIIGSHVCFDEWAIHMAMLFFLMVIMPASFLASSSKLYYKKHWIFYINLAICIVFLIGLSVLNMRFTGEAVIVPNLFLNPMFVIIPAFLYVTIAVKMFTADSFIDYSKNNDKVTPYTD